MIAYLSHSGLTAIETLRNVNWQLLSAVQMKILFNLHLKQLRRFVRKCNKLSYFRVLRNFGLNAI